MSKSICALQNKWTNGYVIPIYPINFVWRCLKLKQNVKRCIDWQSFKPSLVINQSNHNWQSMLQNYNWQSMLPNHYWQSICQTITYNWYFISLLTINTFQLSLMINVSNHHMTINALKPLLTNVSKLTIDASYLYWQSMHSNHHWW